jgi:hypothetical protein
VTRKPHANSSGQWALMSAGFRRTPVARTEMQQSVVTHAKSRNDRGSFLGRLESRGSPGTEAADVEMETPLGFARGNLCQA